MKSKNQNRSRVHELSHRFESKSDSQSSLSPSSPSPSPSSSSYHLNSINRLKKFKLVQTHCQQLQNQPNQPLKLDIQSTGSSSFHLNSTNHHSTTTSTTYSLPLPNSPIDQSLNQDLTTTHSNSNSSSSSSSTTIINNIITSPHDINLQSQLEEDHIPNSESINQSISDFNPINQSNQSIKSSSPTQPPIDMFHQSIHSRLSQDAHIPSLNRFPSDASSANLSDPSHAGPKIFSPRSHTTTEHSSLPQDSCSVTSHPEQSNQILSWAPDTSPLKNISQRSNQSNPFEMDRPSTSGGLHHNPSASTSLERRPYSSLQASDQLDPTQNSSELPSFSYCTGDKRIEELLETLGYSSGLKKSKSSSTMSISHQPTLKDQNHHGRDPVVMLDIEGDEFTIHEHSLSPVSERTELSTISSKRSSNPQAILAQRLMPQNRFRPTAPLCLSPKPKYLSPLSASSVTSSTKRNLGPNLDRPHSTHGVSSTNQDPIPSGSNLSDRAKIFGTSTPSLRPRDTLTKSASSHDLFSSPLQSSSLFPDDTNLTGATTSRPSLQRIPKKATALIQMFEGGSSSPASGSQSSIPIGFPPHKPRPISLSPTKLNSSSSQAAPLNRIQYPIPGPSASTPSRLSAFEAIEASRKARTARQQRQYVSESALNQFASTSTLPATDHDALTTSSSIPFEETEADQQRIQSRNERRERVAQAERGQLVPPPSSPTKFSRQARYQDSLKSPMSERLIQHRKSIASSITSNLSDIQILHHGTIWYRNPQTNQWGETRGILTSDAVYLMNEKGEIDRASSNQSIELNLRNCTAVESVRSKRSYGPDFSDPHLHMLRIAWTEFDPSSNSRVEHEEFLGCTRATQRADWVGAIWQAAHDLGGFIEQPDIPLAGKSSPSAPASPRPDPSHTTSQAPLESEASPKPTQSPRLNAVTLVDRAMSVDERYLWPKESCLVPSTPIGQDMSSGNSTSAASVSSGDTTTLQSELNREYDRSLMGSTGLDLQRQPSDLYREEATQDFRQTLAEVMEQERGVVTGARGGVDYLIDPNLERQLTRKSSRAKSPELDLFAMLDRMSVRGSIHHKTSQFYDQPPPSTPPLPASAPMSMLQRQRSCDMHNPQPISPAEQADISALEQDADKNRRDSSQNSFHTIRPTSAAGIHERFLDSPRSSITSGSKAKSEHQRSSSAQSTPRNQRYVLQDPGTTPRAEQQSVDSRSEHEPNTPIRRGAWSDVDRRSAQTDNEGGLPKRAVQRDLQRILKTIERNDSKLIVQSNSLGDHLDNIQTQLQNVAAKLKGHELERDEEQAGGGEVEEPTIADKVDYMLSLCNILLESQHKVSTAVEKNLKAHGLNLDNKSVHTRSMRSTTNYTNRNSSMTTEPKPISPVPVASLDEDQRSSFSRMPSPPLPPLPTEAETEAAEEEVVKPAEEVLVPVEVQEAGLGRIENLLVALLSRMDEAAAAGKPTSVPEEPAMSPPPLPEKDESTTEDSEMRSTLNLDADVALWKSRGKGSINRSTTDRSTPRRNHRNFTPTETDNSDQPNYQTIPDYNLAYEAEDAVARKIADERARAARRLEGLSTPYGHQHFDLGSRSLYDLSDRHSSNPEMMMQEGGMRHEKSHWSITTPSPGLDASVPPPPPPPKDETELPRLPSLRLSERVQSLRSSRSSATRPVSVISSATHFSQRQQPLPPVPVEQAQEQSIPPPPLPSSVQMVLPTDEIKNVLKETLEDHSNQQAPMFDEMVTLLRTQDQVSQATVLNQAEVSRYLTQLNEHLEGVLVKKNEDVEMITESVRRLQEQLAVLIEQSQRVAPPPEIERPMPDIDHGVVSGEEEEAERGEEADQGGPEEAEGIQFEVEEGAGEVDVTVDVPLQNGADGTGHTRQFSTMTKRPSRIGGPRARKISLGKSLKGPRMPTTLANVGKQLWGGPTPAADRAARWGGNGGGGGTLKRAPTNKTVMSTVGGQPVIVEGALAGLSTAEEGAGTGGVDDPDERTGTIALGVSHILKLLRENQSKEEERRRKKEIEKASVPKPVISNEMEERRAKIEELQLRREAALADDKANHMESLVIAMKQQAAEHDRLLKHIVEQLDRKHEYEEGEEERNRRHEEAMEGVNRVLTTVESGVMTHLEDFKAQMFAEMKQTFEKVGELRDQKQQIQSDIADMLMFMSKVRGGGPDPRWQYPASMPPASIAGSVAGGAGGEYTPIPNLYPIPQMDFSPQAEREDLDGKSVGGGLGGFGPRPPGRR